MINFLIWGLVAYIVLAGVLFGCQRSLLYHPNHTVPNPVDFGLHNISVEWIESVEGHRLLAWWRAPEKVGGPVIVYFHGNAGHLGHRSEKIRPYLEAGYGLLLVSYRYNAGGGGSPSEEGLYADGLATLEFAKYKGAAANRIVLYGESLGTAVAVMVAVKNDVGAVVLQRHSAGECLAQGIRERYPVDRRHAAMPANSLQAVQRPAPGRGAQVQNRGAGTKHAKAAVDLLQLEHRPCRVAGAAGFACEVVGHPTSCRRPRPASAARHRRRPYPTGG